jgi:hypothetical protein
MTITPYHHRNVLDRIPDAPGSTTDVLASLLATGVQPWGGVPVVLARRVPTALWGILTVNVLLSGWLLAARWAVVPLSGWIGHIVTLGGNATLALVLSLACAGLLGVAVPITHGLARANGPQLALIVAGVVLGVVAVAGLVLLAAVGLFVLFLALGAFLFVAERL